MLPKGFVNIKLESWRFGLSILRTELHGREHHRRGGKVTYLPFFVRNIRSTPELAA